MSLRSLCVVFVLFAAITGWPSLAKDASVTRAALVSASTAVRVLTFNVLGSNRDYGRFSDYLEQEKPDIVLLQEAREPWLDQTALADFPYLTRGGMNLVVASRFPFVGDSARLDGGGDGKSRVLRVLVDLGLADPVAVYTFHPSTPRQKNGVAIQEEDYRRLGRAVAAEPADRVIIGGGDFNTVPTSEVFQRFLRETGLGVLAGDTLGVPTRFARELGMPAWLGVAIDHVVARGDVELVSRTVGPDLGSDHLPVLVDLKVN